MERAKTYRTSFSIPGKEHVVSVVDRQVTIDRAIKQALANLLLDAITEGCSSIINIRVKEGEEDTYTISFVGVKWN
jgi:hypothetical protein